MAIRSVTAQLHGIRRQPGAPRSIYNHGREMCLKGVVAIERHKQRLWDEMAEGCSEERERDIMLEMKRINVTLSIVEQRLFWLDCFHKNSYRPEIHMEINWDDSSDFATE